MSGVDLFNAVVDATGLETNKIEQELLDLLEQKNLNVEELNLNNLREIMADYLLRHLPMSCDS